MDQQELRERIIMLADRAGLRVVDEDENRLIKADTCWVDGRVRCPYGQPEGQYILRPQGSCHNEWGAGDGCKVFHEHVADEEVPSELKWQAIRDHFEQEKVTVISELEARAEELEGDVAECMTLRLAADIIKSRKLDRNILLEDDLPK